MTDDEIIETLNANARKASDCLGHLGITLESTIEHVASSRLRSLLEERERLFEALAFYADPENYHAIAILADPPCGEFVDDFDDDHGHPDYDRPMPGKRARSALSLVEEDWQPIESAPRDGTAIQAKIPGNGSDNIIAWADGFLDRNAKPIGGWYFVDGDQEPPECWSDGICWDENEDGNRSVRPTHWKLPTVSEGGI
jgi:hypothetical protein